MHARDQLKLRPAAQLVLQTNAMINRRFAVQLAVDQQRRHIQSAGDAVAVQIGQLVYHRLGDPEAAQIDPAILQEILQLRPRQQLDQLMIAENAGLSSTSPAAFAFSAAMTAASAPSE